MATQVTILVTAVGAIIALIKRMPRQAWSMADAVGELRDGAAVAGRVVRIGWWHLICPSDPVCTVLGVNDSDARESATGHHLSVCFPAWASGSARVEAKVVAWGPALRQLGRPKVAVLRTGRRLPPSVPRLSLSKKSYRGRAHVLLPAPGVSSSAAAGPAGDLDGTGLVIAQPLPPGAAGAPVLAGEPDTGSSDVVALLAADAGHPAGTPAAPPTPATPPPGTGHSVPLIGADSAQTLLDWLNRRRALQLGAVSLAVATVGVVALRWPQDTARIRVTGVGWSGPFDDPIIQKRLSADLQAAGRQASGYTFDVAQKSGVESLAMLTTNKSKLLHCYDFVTCPNDTVRESLEDIIHKAEMHSERHEFCHGSMVLLVRKRAIPALRRADLLVQVRGTSGTEARFDVDRYLLTYDPSRTWRDADPDFTGKYPGNPIKIGFSDPCHAGGGELFLATLRQSQTDLQHSGRLEGPRSQAEWLWGAEGPLYVNGAPTTKGLLFTDLLDHGTYEMGFVYEHDVIRALLDKSKPKRVEEFAILRTSPEAGFKQYLLALNPTGEVVGKAMAGSLADALFQQLRLRAKGKDGDVDQLLAGENLKKARCPVDQIVRHDPEGGRSVTFRHPDLQKLVLRMKTTTQCSP